MDNHIHSQNSEQTKSLQDYVAIFHRRGTLIFVSSGALLCLSLVIAFLWPAVYKSMATILIEEQEIPSELVPFDYHQLCRPANRNDKATSHEPHDLVEGGGAI